MFQKLQLKVFSEKMFCPEHKNKLNVFNDVLVMSCDKKKVVMLL